MFAHKTKREADGHTAIQGKQATKTENARVSARIALAGGGRPGQTSACAPGSRAAVLQCGALRRAKAFAPDARRPGLAGSARHSSLAEAGTTGGFLCLAGAVRVL